MTLFEEKKIDKFWQFQWIKPLDFIRDNFQENLSRSPELKKIKKKKLERVSKKNSGIISAALLSGIFSNEIVYFMFSFSNPVFAETFLVMDSGIDYVFATIAALIGGGLTSLFIDKYYSRKNPEEEKAILRVMKNQLNKQEGKLLYTTFNAHSDIKNLFYKIQKHPTIVYQLKQNYRRNMYSVVSQESFFRTLNNILSGNFNNEDFYIFAYGIEDVKMNEKLKKHIIRKLS
jgi:hypothetical protein